MGSQYTKMCLRLGGSGFGILGRFRANSTGFKCRSPRWGELTAPSPGEGKGKEKVRMGGKAKRKESKGLDTRKRLEINFWLQRWHIHHQRVTVFETATCDTLSGAFVDRRSQNVCCPVNRSPEMIFLIQYHKRRASYLGTTLHPDSSGETYQTRTGLTALSVTNNRVSP